jgi:hypothetical protein
VRGADHDVYVVKTAGPEPREHRVLSRGAAVLLAHAIARRPLFRIGQGFLSATVPEACLPDRVAARLRLRHAANPGLLDGLAVYPCDAWDVESLNACMPGLIEDAAAVRAKGVAAVSYARHGRGRLRLEWKSGLTVGSTSFGRGAG